MILLNIDRSKWLLIEELLNLFFRILLCSLFVQRIFSYEMDPEEPTQESHHQDSNEATQNSAFSFGESGNMEQNTLGAPIPDSQDQSMISPTPADSAPVRRNINAGSFLGSQISRSDLLSTQLSVDSRHSGATILRRGDIQPTGALEKYLNSEVRSEIRPTSPGFLSSQGQDAFGTAPVIWGTTINIEDSMDMFRDFINNYKAEGGNVPFYPNYLQRVRSFTF